MPRPFVAGNWKMYKTVREVVAYIKEFRSVVKDLDGIDIVLAAPFTAVHAAAEAARSSNVAIAAQDVYWEAQGAFTGEVSAPMIQEAGAEYVIIGHSERRTLFGETDESVRRKVAAALEADLTPIVCIGETLQQRDHNETFAVLTRQLAEGLKSVEAAHLPALVVAYEPIWAIGTGKTATSDDAQTVCKAIRERLAKVAGQATADAVRIQYGGSVKAANIAELMGQADIDGALVGGASLDPDEFAKIIAYQG